MMTIEEFMNRVSSVMIEKMNELDYSNVDIARMLDVNKSTVGDWINKKTLIKAHLIKPLCDALKITPNYLFGANSDKEMIIALQIYEAVKNHPDDYSSLSKILEIDVKHLMKD